MYPSLVLLLLVALLRHSHQPVEQNAADDVGYDVYPHQTKVPPTVGVVDEE